MMKKQVCTSYFIDSKIFFCLLIYLKSECILQSIASGISQLIAMFFWVCLLFFSVLMVHKIMVP